jgi:tRNA threonylcarbamoyladenosine biosynthesis protein TsaB
MIILIDTSTPTCALTLVDETERFEYEWLAERGLAKGLLGYLQETLTSRGAAWTDITGIGIFEGPGSFTGLRIGCTVMNTIAGSEGIPIVAGRGENWKDSAIERLAGGENDSIVMPFYGSEAHITQPRK